jgi:hypothetical protein
MAYEYKRRSFAASAPDSDDDDVDLFTAKPKRQKLGNGAGRTRKDDSAAKAATPAVKSIPAHQGAMVKPGDEDDYIELLDSCSSSQKAPRSQDILDITAEEEALLLSQAGGVQDAAVVQAKAQLEKLKRLKTASTLTAGDYASTPTHAPSSCLPAKSSVSRPVIKTAAERLLEKVSRVDQLIGQSKPAVSSSSSSSSSSGGATVIAPADRLRVKTRLNKKHEYEFEASTKFTVAQLKNMFRQVYGLAADEKVSLEFEGDKLQDSNTLDDSDLMDQDLVDARIQADLVADAVQRADAFRKEGRTPSVDAAPAVAPAAPAPAAVTPDVVTLMVEFPVSFYGRVVKRTQFKLRSSMSMSVLYQECAKPAKANCQMHKLLLSRTPNADGALAPSMTIKELKLNDGCVLYAMPLP